jgi:hypothetical protein
MRLGRLAWLAILCVALIPHCGAPCADGTPCTEGEVGSTCGATDCESFVCDGTEFTVVKKGAGDPCNDVGASCAPSQTGQCPSSFLFCGPDNRLVDDPGVSPGNACTQDGQTCRFPETECQDCICAGGHWVCQMSGCCVTSCFDAGGPCPSRDDVVAGASCQPAHSCLSAHACGFSSQVFAFCDCAAGTWSCPFVCDGG